MLQSTSYPTSDRLDTTPDPAPSDALATTSAERHADPDGDRHADPHTQPSPDADDRDGAEDVDQSPPRGRRVADGGARAGHDRPADRALNLLLHAAERDVRVGLTVTVGGVVVSGTLIGTLAYCRALADQFASAAGGTEMDETFADSFRDLVDDVIDVAEGDRRDPPDPAAYERAIGFVHLAEARYVTPAGLLPLGRHGLLWRCPVSEVTSWSIGDLLAR